MFQFKSPDKMFEIRLNYASQQKSFLDNMFNCLDEYFNNIPPTERNDGSYEFELSETLVEIIENITAVFPKEIATTEKIFDTYINEKFKNEYCKYTVCCNNNFITLVPQYKLKV